MNDRQRVQSSQYVRMFHKGGKSSYRAVQAPRYCATHVILKYCPSGSEVTSRPSVHSACRHKDTVCCQRQIEKKMKQNRQPLSFWLSLVRNSIQSQSAKRSKLSPKIQAVWRVLLSLSLYPRSAFMSVFYFSPLVFVPSITFASLLLDHTRSPFLSWLGKYECGRQMARMFQVSEGSCSFHSPSPLPCQEVSKVGWRVIGNWQGESWHKGCLGRH